MNAVRHADALDPRVERSRRVVCRAALAEFGAVGYGAFAIESVAARAGVGKSTIYRHWPDKATLIADALETLNVQPPPDLAHAAPRERVEQLLRHLAEVVVDPTFSACIPALVDAAERDARLRELHHAYSARRRRALVQAIADGVAAGDFPAAVDADLAASALSGAVFYRRLMTDEPLDAAHVPQLIDTVLGPARSSRVSSQR